MTSVHRIVNGVILAVAVAASVKPLAAETVSQCYDRVIETCNDALEGAKWYEKVAIGAMCSGMLAGCTGNVLH